MVIFSDILAYLIFRFHVVKREKSLSWMAGMPVFNLDD